MFETALKYMRYALISLGRPNEAEHTLGQSVSTPATVESAKNKATFGYWLRRKRKALDLTQEDLAYRVGCSSETIRKIETGRRRPSRQLAELLATNLEVPSQELPALVRFARLGPEALDPGLLTHFVGHH